MDDRILSRRTLAGGVAAIGIGVAFRGFSVRQVDAAQATPASPASGFAGCDPLALLPQVPAFTVISDDVHDGEQLPLPQMGGIFGAGGEDLSPQLSWSGFPPETKSFTVTMYDPQAATGSGFWHWAVADIPGDVTELPTGAGAPGDAKLPAGAFQLPNDARLAQYAGSAPPPGEPPHHYYIVVTALDVATVDVPKDGTPEMLGFTIGPHTLARAVIVPIASRTA
ncbi:MAG: YbhB/YbcL family Raf kinase inhibitor-like protein [Thermomicrobiales bacterium]|nr:YbhB/YbcL family Raf kinase inhibitor-like protein [Thermomicrobiales bacterium]